MCHKWPQICSTCHKHFPVLSSFTTYCRVFGWINTTGATNGAGTAYPSEAPEFTPVFSGVRVTRSLVLYVCFVDRCLSFCTFSFGHCVVCSSIYGFWLPLWYLQTLPNTLPYLVHCQTFRIITLQLPSIENTLPRIWQHTV
jgi:hypothetical protein